MPTAIHRKISLAERGELPQAICRLTSGWVIAGDVQHLRGYCVVLRDPVARDFNALTLSERAQFAVDTTLVGDALLATAGAYRINYETWGNLDPALHTHVVPRFSAEPDALRVLPPRQAYDWANGPPFDPSRDRAWMDEVRAYLSARGARRSE